MYKIRLNKIDDIDLLQPVAKACQNPRFGEPYYIKTGIVSEIEQYGIVVIWKCPLCLPKNNRGVCEHCEKESVTLGSISTLCFALKP